MPSVESKDAPGDRRKLLHHFKILVHVSEIGR